MGSRALRRATQPGLDSAGLDASSSDEEPTPRAAPASFLHLLGDDDDGDQAPSSEDEAPTPAPAPVPTPAPAPAPASVTLEEDPPSGKKKKKKKKKKGKGTAAVVEEEDEDNDLALLEATARANVAGVRTASVASVWVVESKELDAEGEMRRKFGSRVVRAAEREGAAAAGRGRGRQPPALTARRALLVTPKSDWGRPRGLISQAVVDTVPGPHGTVASLFAFSWSAQYVQLERQFEQLVQMSADPNMLMELLRHEPCHVAALEQLHRIAAQTGQAEMASEFLERVIFSYEASWACCSRPHRRSLVAGCVRAPRASGGGTAASARLVPHDHPDLTGSVPPHSQVQPGLRAGVAAR